jgi:serine/threonine-protein kinase RsbW
MLDQPCIWRCERVLPSLTRACSHFMEEVLSQLEAQGWEMSDTFGVQLAMEEALVNAVKHGNRSDPAKNVSVRCEISSESFCAQVTDEGDGFDPSQVPDPTDPEQIENPHGRGILLMRNFMSRVEYNERGNCVSLEKRRTKSE